MPSAQLTSCYHFKVEYLKDLNEEQKKAVLHRDRPLLVLAGAGSGKTRVITYRILSLIREGVSPSEILAITFTNKAAKEMKDRVGKLLGKDKMLNFPVFSGEYPFISTFHSLGVHLLRQNYSILGIPKHFSIFDRQDSLKLVKEALERSGLDPKQHDASKILGAISRLKGDMLRPEDIEGETGSYSRKNLAQIYSNYQKILKEEKGFDFDDLLLESLSLLKNNKAVLKKYNDLWKYIHIDEYQDTNLVQYEMAKILSPHGNICVVGDVDQNIYSWRGADIRNILNFERDFENAEVVILEENYRSTPIILEAANKVIEKNAKRYEKKLFTKKISGEKIHLEQSLTEKDEAEFVVLKASELISSGAEPKEIAVFYRANFQSRILEEAFLNAGIPYQVLGTRFFERKEVKDLVAYIDASLNRDKLSAQKRIMNYPPRGIGKVTMLAAFSGAEDRLNDGAKVKLRNFRKILDDIKINSEELSVSKLVAYTAKISGIEDLLSSGSDDEKERIFNLKELENLARRYDGMPKGDGVLKFLEDAALASDQDELREDKNGVKLMTVHASKGLEFDYCFITGLEDGLFPMRLSDEKISEDEKEEERRLFYVALTRARKKVFLTLASIRTVFGSQGVNLPSEFLLDIPEDLIEVSGDNSAPRRHFGSGEEKIGLIDWD